MNVEEHQARISYEESLGETKRLLHEVVDIIMKNGIDWSGKIPLANRCNGLGISGKTGVYKIMDITGDVVYYGEGKIFQRIKVCHDVYLKGGKPSGGNKHCGAEKMYDENPDICNWFFSYSIQEKQEAKCIEKRLIDQDSPRFNSSSQAGANI